LKISKKFIPNRSGENKREYFEKEENDYETVKANKLRERKERRSAMPAKKERKPRKFFTSQEDQIILETQKMLGDQCIPVLVKNLGRNRGAIVSRLETLIAGRQLQPRKLFTLEEDLKIVDKVFEVLPGKSSLSDLELSWQTIMDLTKELKRHKKSIINRTHCFIKSSLMQYYTGTLNLDIRLFLVKHLAENYDDYQDINWTEVVKKPECCGHDVKSVKLIFQMLKYKASRIALGSERVSLKELAENISIEIATNSKYAKSAFPNSETLKRQQTIIDYFEVYIKKKRLLRYSVN